MNLTIRRGEWLRGEGADRSYLLRTDGKRCCVGIYLRALGVPDKVMDGVSIADYPSIVRIIGSDHWLIPNGVCRDVMHLYERNDYPHLPEEERERRIAELFVLHGVVVTFED